ncbi:MAG: heme ABC transporter ATP-binding protein [Nocardioides sp.]|uniref:heme ABC transporter ATP-binding protein n=1 Tax=Nocardioides sp. TaxID=35761 RepID=UPI0039E59DF1
MLLLDQVCVRLGEHQALTEVSTSVAAGELVALVGPNGAGKTTLLSVMSGDLAPDSGTARLDGQDVASYKALALARRRGVLPQENRLAFGFRSVDVVRMGRAPWARTEREDEDEEVVAAAMIDTDVLGLADRAYPSLSGGEKARTSFARVLAQQTPLVLLDEPTAALDLRHQDQVLAQARRLTAQGCAVVAVLHDLSVAAAYADRICLMQGGRVVADGPPVEVLLEDRLGEVYQHPVDVIEHHGRLLVVPRRLSLAPPTEEMPWPAAR